MPREGCKSPVLPLRTHPWHSSPPQQALGEQGWRFATSTGDSRLLARCRTRVGAHWDIPALRQLLAPIRAHRASCQQQTNAASEAAPGVSLSPGNPRIRELIALTLCPCLHKGKYRKDDLPDPAFPHPQSLP